tara:strand:+ start:3300 stop:4388 length:1089 start_codon:yes stop_codon:yes gene_type:complete
MYKLIFAFVCSWFSLSFLASSISISAEELALGRETSTYYAKGKAEDIIHAGPIHLWDDFINGWKLRGEKEVILLLGNSQYHAINQMREGDIVLSEILFNRFGIQNYEFLTISMANASLQEQYLIFNHLSKTISIKFLVLPIFMDDTRENIIRHEVKEYLKLKPTYDKTNFLNHKISEERLDDQVSDFTGLDKTIQKNVEQSITQYLNNHFYLWFSRPKLRAELFGNLHLIRNTIFNISASTKRKVIKGPYEDNFTALELILESCNLKDIENLIYIPPIRKDVELPYYKKEYNKFQSDVISLTNKYNTNFKSFENAIPAEFWGVKDATSLSEGVEIDFMHFQFKGHEILSDSLYKTINDIILE